MDDNLEPARFGCTNKIEELVSVQIVRSGDSKSTQLTKEVHRKWIRSIQGEVGRDRNFLRREEANRGQVACQHTIRIGAQDMSQDAELVRFGF